MAVACFDGAVTNRYAHARLRTPLMVGMAMLGVAWFVGVTQSIVLISPTRLRAGEAWAGAAARTFYAVPTLFTHTMAWSFGLAACGAALQILQVRLPAARAAMRGLQRTRDYIRNGFPVLENWMNSQDGLFSYTPPQASAVSFIRYSLDINSTELMEKLCREASVFVGAGDSFGMDHHLRIAFGQDKAVLEDAFARMERVLRSVS